MLHLLAIAWINPNLARPEMGNQWTVHWRNTHLTHFSRGIDHLCLTGVDLSLSTHYVYTNLHCHRGFLAGLLFTTLFGRLFDAAYHVEGLLGQMIILAINDCLKSGDGIFQ